MHVAEARAGRISKERLPIYNAVHIVYSGLGGHAGQLFSLLGGGFLNKTKHHVILAGVEPPVPEYIEKLDALGIEWSYVGKPSGKDHYYFYSEIRRKILASDPDIILANGLAAAPAIVLMLMSRDKKIRTILRDSQPFQLKSWFQWCLLAASHCSVDRIVYLTAEAEEKAKKKLGAFHRGSKVRVINNGVDTDFFCPTSKGDRSQRIINIGMVSRLQKTKDHSTLLRAFSSLVDAYPDTSIALHIVGDGETRASIEQEINEKKISDKVTMHGLLSENEVKKLLQSLDIYVHATLGETMSNSIMQAMSSGLPIIASDVDGVNNMINGESGILYPSGDDCSLFKKLEIFIEDEEIAVKFGEHARLRAVSLYGNHTVARMYENMIFDIDL